MKKYIFVVLSILLSCSLFAQEQDIDESNISSGDVVNILEGNVAKLWPGEIDADKYDTALKVKLFLESDAGKPYAEKLKTLQKSLKTTGIVNIPDENSPVMLSDYDTKKGGFYLVYQTNDTIKVPLINYFYCKFLPADFYTSNRNYNYYDAFLPLDEKQAVNIDGNNNVGIKLKMTIDGEVSVGTFFTNQPRVNMPDVSSMEIIAYDKVSGKVYATWTVKAK
jgi:hypothetical protein